MNPHRVSRLDRVSTMRTTRSIRRRNTTTASRRRNSTDRTRPTSDARRGQPPRSLYPWEITLTASPRLHRVSTASRIGVSVIASRVSPPSFRGDADAHSLAAEHHSSDPLTHRPRLASGES